MYNSHVINSFDNFLNLRSEWENLRVKNKFSLFSSFEWYWCLLKANKNKIKPFIIVIKNIRTGKIEGILPLQRVEKYSLSGLKSLVCGDTHYFEFIVEKNHEEEIVATLYDLLCRLNSISYIELIPVSENHSPLMRLATSNKNFYIKDERRSPYLSCAQPFEDLLNSKSKKSRQRTRNHLNRFARLGKVTIEKVSHLQSSDFDDILRISKGSWKGEVGNAINSKETTKAFFQHLSDVAERHEWLQVWFLSVDEQRLAMEFHLQEQDTVYALRGDYLEQFKKHSPGRYLDYYIIKDLCNDEHVLKYDMCGDLSDYKKKWTQSSQQFFRILWIKSPFIRTLYNVKQLTA